MNNENNNNNTDKFNISISIEGVNSKEEMQEILEGVTEFLENSSSAEKVESKIEEKSKIGERYIWVCDD